MSASQFPQLTAKQSTKRCTNCSSLMSLYQLPGHYGQTIDLDVCHDCNAIWFDQWESSQLSPDGVVALFQLINERGGTASSAGAKLGEGLRCVTCGDGMKLTNDRVRNTRFVYQACRHGHGRLTTFYNFLSEKQFVRELTQAERTKLCATVKQVKCSGCGAPVDLAKHDACAYCRAPVSVFDRDAAKKAIEHYLQQRHKQVPLQPPQDYGHSQPHRGRDGWNTWDTIYAADLATDLLWALGRAASRGLARGAPTAALGAGAVLADPGPGLATAADLLFGESSAVASSNLVTDAAAQLLGNAGSAVGGALPSATEALFGGGNASDLFGAASSGIGDAASGALDTVSDLGGDVASGLGDVASSAGDGVADLVSDGIGSFVSSIFS